MHSRRVCHHDFIGGRNRPRENSAVQHMYRTNRAQQHSTYMKDSHRSFPFPRPGRLPLLPFLILFLYSLLSAPALAAAPQLFVLENLSLAEERDALVFHCSVSVDDEDGLRDLLKDGAVLELTIDLTLERKRSWWLNADGIERVFTLGLRHDPLSRNFLVSVPGAEAQEILRDKNLTRLLHAGWRQMKLPLAPMQLLRDQGRENIYLLTATFRLQHTEVPPWLEKSLVFWSSDVVSQETRTLEYQY